MPARGTWLIPRRYAMKKLLVLVVLALVIVGSLSAQKLEMYY